MTNLLENPIFQDETKAREWVESQIWANGVVCPHCGNADQEKVGQLEGKAHRPSLWKCYECREQFSCTVGTVLESSKIPLTKWVAALFLMTASKKGISAHQVHRMLGISYKSTWFLMHRLREAMRTGGLEPLGGEGAIVEADETYFGKAEVSTPSVHRRGRPYLKKGKHKNNRPIVALVERGGKVRSFHAAVANKENVTQIVRDNVAKESRLMTDESNLYKDVSGNFTSHDTVKHTAGEYVRYWNTVTNKVRPDGKPVVETTVITTNTIESYFSIFKRGMRGTYQHCAEKHLHRYLAEFDFRHNNRIALGIDDTDRADQLAKGIVGKRLTYRRPNPKDIPF